MSTAQIVREPCRHILSRPRIPASSTSISILDGCRPTQRAFSQTFAVHADDDGKDTSRIRQSKTPTRLRRRMYMWLNGPGRPLANPLPGSTNYLSAYTPEGILRNESSLPPAKDSDLRPYPLNKNFVSQRVLSEEMKDAIHSRVAIQGNSISAVSADFGVDMRRVAAVVRLKEVEKSWQKQGKTFADSYATSVMNMLPQTQYRPGKRATHESINDLPVHPATKQQIFYPTSESRQITRQDAAKIFSPTLLPADERIPHPELIETERGSNEMLSPEDKTKLAKKLREATASEKAKAERKRAADEAARTTVVKASRWNFKFETIDTNSAGRDGRGPAGVGWRYGMPYEDRKRGHLKGVPSKVEV
ncbi:hypothetical protein ANO11243_001030 [Dothideomycetidae sp. 11243]|nr:hypothetical protein ANO11243_001030 [fungal sp. No.11243]